MTDFEFRTVRSSVSEVHAEEFPEDLEPQVWFIQPDDSAVVLGSTQPLVTLDLGELAARGLGVVRRHSGGGAVVVRPDTATWFDVWLPIDDARFEIDVSRSSIWLGGVVVTALGTLGIDGVVAQATEPRSRWSPLVCFAGVAAGEVLVGGRKAVGISQRRTRIGARFQVTVLHEFHPEATASLFALDEAAREELVALLRARVGPIALDRARFRDALEAAFSSS